MNTFLWLVKREFWEHRGGFLRAPVITAAIFLVLNLMGIVTGEVMGRQMGFHLGIGSNNLHLLTQELDKQSMEAVGAGLDLVMYSSTMIIGIVLGFVVFFYCLGALYDDRRDRSILFWKSLPVSDTATVLSKVVSATVVAPLIAVVVGALTGLVMLLMFAITLSLHGVSVWHLLGLSHPLQVMANLVGSIPLYVLWALPTVGWLMLCSAWARSKPFLWAVALPVAVGLLITWFGIMGLFNLPASWFWQEVVGRGLLSLFPGGSFSASPREFTADGASNMSLLGVSHTWAALGTANLWIGVLAGVVLIAGAIWFRRWRDDS